MRFRVPLPFQVLVVLLLAQSFVFCPTGLFAQGPEEAPRRPDVGPRRGPDPSFALLLFREVQSELKLSAEQTEAVEAIESDLLQQFRAGFGPRGPRPGGNEGANAETSANPFTQRSQVIMKLWSTVLEANQFERYQQLVRQVQPLRTIEEEEVATRLEISPAQLESLGERRRANRRMSLEEARQTLQEVLTADQFSKWESLCGDAFEFSPEIARAMGGRFRGPRRESLEETSPPGDNRGGGRPDRPQRPE